MIFFASRRAYGDLNPPTVRDCWRHWSLSPVPVPFFLWETELPRWIQRAKRSLQSKKLGQSHSKKIGQSQYLLPACAWEAPQANRA
eukprot:s486_g19.t1